MEQIRTYHSDVLGEVTVPAPEMSRKEAVVWTVIGAIDDAIREAGNRGVPSGHVYAAVMGTMSLETYERIIGILTESGKVKRTGDLLVHVC